MTGEIHRHTAKAMLDAQLQAASQRQRLEACRQPLERSGDDLTAHERQRALVCASLLMTRREDPPPHRRDAIGG